MLTQFDYIVQHDKVSDKFQAVNPLTVEVASEDTNSLSTVVNSALIGGYKSVLIKGNCAVPGKEQNAPFLMSSHSLLQYEGKLNVANGYASDCIRVTSHTDGSRVIGANYSEVGGAPLKNWTGIHLMSDKGFLFNDMFRDCYFNAPKTGVFLDNMGTGKTGWITSCFFENIYVNWFKQSMVEWSMDTVNETGYPSNSQFHGFTNVQGQFNPNAYANTATGFRNIKGVGVTFNNCGAYDATTSQVSCNITSQSFGTSIFGGFMTSTWNPNINVKNKYETYKGSGISANLGQNTYIKDYRNLIL
jgi:hypothetical protein